MPVMSRRADENVGHQKFGITKTLIGERTRIIREIAEFIGCTQQNSGDPHGSPKSALSVPHYLQRRYAVPLIVMRSSLITFNVAVARDERPSTLQERLAA
jgi:hypothetical protein